MADDYNTMQAQAGLMAPVVFAPPQTMWPGQVSAQLAQGGFGGGGTGNLAGAMGFQQPIPTFTGGPMMMPGAGGVMMPMMPGGPTQSYGAGMGGGMGPMTPPSMWGGYGPQMPPPQYRGYMGQPMNMVSPGQPSSYFSTPFQAAYGQSEASSMRDFGSGMAGIGVAGRGFADFGMAAAGAALGGRFGGGRGAVVGGVAGFLGSEFGGMGQGGQNAFMNTFAAPAINMRAYGAGIENLSQGFMSGGNYGSITGSGFSRGASVNAARQIEDMSNSDSFRRETFNRFNTADVMRITQGAAQGGLMQGVQSPDEMRTRVRDVAKQLQSFMELANEPDLQRAISTMSNMRSQGMNLQETTQAVQNGRAFARMAGTTFETLANIGGAQGASTFGSMGLSQGLGARVGMANMGMAASSQNMGTINPAVMNMLGGAQGMASMNNMFSAGMLQMPMIAPGMMNAQGGLNAGSIQALMQGRTDPMSMTGRGSNTLGAMTGSMGIGGLGMAVGMQPVLQDAIGRAIQQQGPFAQRMTEDRQIMALSRRMGLHGSEGFMTAAQMMGMSGTQAYARGTEMGDPRRYDRMRDQVETNRQERRAEEIRAGEANRPGFLEETTIGQDVGSALHRAHSGIRRAYEYVAGGGANDFYTPDSAAERRRQRASVRSGAMDRFMADNPGTSEGRGWGDRMRMNTVLAEQQGFSGVFADVAGMAIDARQSVGQREASLLAIRHEGSFAESLLNTGAHQSSAASARLGADAFGGSNAARSEFARLTAERYNSPGSVGGLGMGTAHGINGAFQLALGMGTRGVGGLIAGSLSGPYGEAGSDMRQHQQDYVRAARATGSNLSDEQLREQFAQHQGSLGAAASPEVLLRTTNAGQARMRDTALRGAGISDASHIDARAQEEGAYRGLLGGAAGSRDSRRTFDSVNRMFEGFSGNDAHRQLQQNVMTSMALLTTRLNRPGSGAEANTQLTAVIEEARRRGMSQSEIDRLSSRVAGRQQALRGNEDITALSQSVNISGTGADILNRVGATNEGAMNAANQRHMNWGAALTARRGGELGRLFEGAMHDGQVDTRDLRSRLMAADAGAIGEEDSTIGAAIRRMQRSTGAAQDRAFHDIELSQTAGGERKERVMERIRHGGGTVAAGWRRGSGIGAITGAIRGLFTSESAAADEALAGGTRSDREANEQAEGIGAFQNQAEGQGMGGTGDRLARAAESLEQVTRNLNGIVQSRGMDGMVGDGN